MQRILWLIDPFEELKLIRPSAAVVKGLVQGLKVPFQAVHVLSGGAGGFAPEIQAAWLMQFVVDTEDRLQRVVKHFAIPKRLDPHVISEVYASRSEAVAGFLEYASENDALLIVVQRSARGKRMGGFAETLLLKSGIPVLVVPSVPASKAWTRPKKLMVALDLSEADQEVASEVFSRALEWAVKMRVALHLFHVLPVPPTIAYGPGAFDLGASAAAAVYWSEEAAQARKKQLEQFKNQAKKKGVRCTVELETRPIRAADAILRAQKRSGSDWIVMAGKSGRWSTLILGSVTRMVARSAPCPVWIIHLEKKSQQQRAA